MVVVIDLLSSLVQSLLQVKVAVDFNGVWLSENYTERSVGHDDDMTFGQLHNVP